MNRETETLDQLIESYCEFANKLSQYKREHGFEPGALVEARFQDTVKTGVIPAYGNMWYGIDHMSVPVLLETGRVQPWSVKYLTIVRKAPSVEQEGNEVR